MTLDENIAHNDKVFSGTRHNREKIAYDFLTLYSRVEQL